MIDINDYEPADIDEVSDTLAYLGAKQGDSESWKITRISTTGTHTEIKSVKGIKDYKGSWINRTSLPY